MTAGRVAPQEHPVRVQPVAGAVVAEPVHRGADILQRRREARLAAEPVVDRRHRGNALFAGGFLWDVRGPEAVRHVQTLSSRNGSAWFRPC